MVVSKSNMFRNCVFGSTSKWDKCVDYIFEMIEQVEWLC